MRFSKRVQPTQTLYVVKNDPPDNRILECAVASESDYIVTGDMRHLLRLGNYRGIPIVNATEFLEPFERDVSRQS